MDAITLLKKDHDNVRKMLAQLAETTTRGVKTRRELLEKIHTELSAHSLIEEEIFYPAFKQAGEKSDDAKMFYEAMEEHRAVDDLVLPDLLKADPASEQFGGRAKVLKELIEHHVKEEEKEMFPRAKKLLGAGELESLGKQMQQRKMAELKSAA